jgi:hypothetical protein
MAMAREEFAWLAMSSFPSRLKSPTTALSWVSASVRRHSQAIATVG